MAYLKPQTPLKDLNSGDYFYPLTTIDLIITGTSRLSAYLSEDSSNHNLLNLSNIGNLNVSGNTTINGNLTVSGNTIFDNSVDIKYNNFITFYGKNNNTSPMARMGYMSAISGGACHSISINDGYQTSGAFYIWSNGCDVGNDNGGIAIDNEGVTVFGAGDPASNFTGVFRVINEDDIASGPKFLVQKNGHTFIPAHLAVGGYNNTSYGLSCNSFICDDWIRTVGATGWYNESYGGGWYMSDGEWIRTYNNKSVYTGGGTLRSDSDVWGNRVHLSDNWIGFYQYTSGGSRYGYILTDANRMYFRKENGNSDSAGATFDFNGPIYTNGHGIYAQHGHIMTVAGNEVNFIPDGYNSTFWFNYETFNRANNGNISEYIMGNGQHGYANLRANKVYNAVWNDFAEYREGDITEPGRVVAATLLSNKVTKTTIRLLPCAHIISDTFGCSVGLSDTAKTPIGVAGRVLVYPYLDISNYKIGDCLCAAPNGTADIMSREEIISYPDRIIGIVDEIPTYEYWNLTLTTNKKGDAEFKIQTKIKVDGRIWVYVR